MPVLCVLIENDLLKLGILDRRRASLYGEIRRLRNQLVHGKTTDVPVTEIQFATNAITTLMKRVESDTYFDFIRQMSQEELESEIDWLVADSINEILNSEEFGDATADANAYDWDVHHYEVQSIEWNHNEYVVSIDFEASGDQDEEKARFGDTVTGSIRAVLKADGEFEFEEIHAQLVDPYEEDEPDIYVDEPEDEPDES